MESLFITFCVHSENTMVYLYVHMPLSNLHILTIYLPIHTLIYFLHIDIPSFSIPVSLSYLTSLFSFYLYLYVSNFLYLDWVYFIYLSPHISLTSPFPLSSSYFSLLFPSSLSLLLQLSHIFIVNSNPPISNLFTPLSPPPIHTLKY